MQLWKDSKILNQPTTKKPQELKATLRKHRWVAELEIEHGEKQGGRLSN